MANKSDSFLAVHAIFRASFDRFPAIRQTCLPTLRTPAMFGIHDLTLFVLSGLLLNLTPGPDSLLVITRSAAQGWLAGAAAALGIAAGTCLHILAAALGLSALLATSATAFTLVKLMGAAYLVWLGLGLLFRRPHTQAKPAGTSAVSLRRVFLQGFLSNALNPKVALFFLAFVPQFIAPDGPDQTLAFLILGGIFNLNSLLWCLLLAVATARASARLRPGEALGRWLHRAIGGLFIALGVKLSLAGRS